MAGLSASLGWFTHLSSNRVTPCDSLSSIHLHESKVLHLPLILKSFCLSAITVGREKPYKNQWLYFLAKKNHLFWKMNSIPDVGMKSSCIPKAHAPGRRRHASPIKILKRVFFLQRSTKSNYIHMSGIFWDSWWGFCMSCLAFEFYWINTSVGHVRKKIGKIMSGVLFFPYGFYAFSLFL